MNAREIEKLKKGLEETYEHFEAAQDREEYESARYWRLQDRKAAIAAAIDELS